MQSDLQHYMLVSVIVTLLLCPPDHECTSAIVAQLVFYAVQASETMNKRFVKNPREEMRVAQARRPKTT